MKNPLLIPELRGMLASNAFDEIRDFCTDTEAPIAAEFLGALLPDELRVILRQLDPDLRTVIFTHLDDDVKLEVLARVEEDETIQLLARMEDEARLAWLETVPEAQQARLRELLERRPSKHAAEVLSDLIEIQTAPEEPAPEKLSAEELAAEIRPHLEVYRFVDGRVERIPRVEKGCWVNIVDPPRDSLPLIAQRFKIPLDFLTASLDLDETARIEIEDEPGRAATLLTVKVPYFDERNIDVLYFTIPVGIILVNGLILTVCSKSSSVLNDFVDNKVRHVGGGHRFILQLIMRATLLYLQHLKQLNNAANIIQKKLEQETRNRQLLKLFSIEKSLVYFTTSLKSNLLMLERLRRLRVVDLSDETNDNLLEDIFTEGKQAIEMANIYSDILSGMMDAFASVISNNLNIVMKLLTSFTIIMTIPVLVTSSFGMNVRLPFQSHPFAFPIIFGISIALVILAVYFFIKKKWLEL